MKNIHVIKKKINPFGIIAFFFLIYGLISSAVANDKNNSESMLKSLLFSEVKVLDLYDSCISKGYLISISFRSRETLKYIKKCDVCNSSSIYTYYCDMARLNYYIKEGDFLSASVVVKGFSDSERFEFFNEKDTADALGKSNYLYQLSHVKKRESVSAHLDLLGGRYYHNDYLVDTGSVYTTSHNCDKKIGEVSVYYISNDRNSLDLCLANNGGISVKFEADILGLYDILNFDVIYFSEEKEWRHERELFIDNDTLFFVAETKWGGVNVCLDSGAKDTVVAAKMYKKLYKSIIENPVVMINARNSAKNVSMRAKFLYGFDIDLGEGKNVYYEKIPVIIDHNQWIHCDIVAGADFISNFVSHIRLKENEIYIK